MTRKVTKRIELTGTRDIGPADAHQVCVAVAMSIAMFIAGKKLTGYENPPKTYTGNQRGK